MAWSDQGDRLAITINRQKHSFIGLFTPGDPCLQWLDPAFDRDCQPVWSPDGKHIAYYRCHGITPDAADLLFSNYSDPFELRIADSHTLQSHCVWLSPEDHGLSIQEGVRPLLWQDNLQVLFSHEATAWDHIYRLDINTWVIESLTEGQYLVQSYGLDRHNKQLYYTHNNNNLHGYHLARLNLDNGNHEDLQSLLPGESIVSLPVPVMSGEALGVIICSRSQPMIPGIIKSQEKTVTLYEQAEYQKVARHFVDIEPVSFSSSDGLMVHGQLFKPKGSGPFPALLTVHGGPWCQTLAGFNALFGLSQLYACCQYLANQGFVVFSLNYRGSSGYGKAFRHPGPYFWNGASEYQDVVAARHWLAKRPDVDGKRIGIWGKSYGGYLTAMALARNSDLFIAGVDIEGCHHIPRELRQKHWGSELFTLHAGEEADVAQKRSQIALESSPWHYLDSWRSPVLLIHPDDDRNVQFEESQQLFHELRKRKVSVEGMAIPNEVHSFLRHKPWVDSYIRSIDFLKHYLNP